GCGAAAAWWSSSPLRSIRPNQSSMTKPSTEWGTPGPHEWELAAGRSVRRYHRRPPLAEPGRPTRGTGGGHHPRSDVAYRRPVTRRDAASGDAGTHPPSAAL